MSSDIEQELLATFKTELDEQSQVIVESLLSLEKNNLTEEEKNIIIQTLFRAAHTIKGAARSVSINDVGEIAHNMEDLFIKIQKKQITLTHEMISSCLESVDLMKEAMSPKKKTITHQANSIRVDVAILDNVSSLMDDLVMNKIALEELINKLHGIEVLSKRFFQVWTKLNNYIEGQFSESLTEELHKINDEGEDLLLEQNFQFLDFKKNVKFKINEMTILSHVMQEEVNKLRLVPASVMFNLIPRQVRDLAHELKKSVNLEIIGSDVKMDKMVLDAIKDPIIHLLRNAIDHGIEDAETREKHKKSVEGKLTIEIVDKGNQIQINISDDGSGIDLERVKHIAENMKLFTRAELDEADPNEILKMIFLPGFSTKKAVSSVSGRGVGLDVVTTNLERVKGRVEVSTDFGKGTVFTLLLPLTLSSEHGLLIKSQGNIYAIPSMAIDRIYATSNQNIKAVAGGHVVMLDKHPAPVFLLSALIGGRSDYGVSNQQVTMVIVKKGRQRVALLVDDVMSEREMIIKPLQPPLSNLACVAGGTLSDDGQVIYVLNPSNLVDRALNNAQVTPISFNQKQQEVVQAPHILVVDDSITTRTLERNILESRNYLVTVAVNGREAWDLLQKINFSIIITDVNMPEMDGFELTAKIKQSTRFKDLPVVIVTSLESEEEKRRGIEVGANAYIIKSQFESGALLEIVSQLVK